MKSIQALRLFVLLGCAWLALQACAALTAPIATEMISGAGLAIKGAELQKEIRKADVQEAVDRPFERVWDMSIITMVDLGIEIIKSERNPQDDGGVIEGLVKKRKIKVIVVKLTEKITEIGIWTKHDLALAGLIAQKIKEEAKQPDEEVKKQDKGS